MLGYAEACNEFAGPYSASLRPRVTQLSKKCRNADEPLATLRPIWPDWDFNHRPPTLETNAFPLNRPANRRMWLMKIDSPNWFTVWRQIIGTCFKFQFTKQKITGTKIHLRANHLQATKSFCVSKTMINYQSLHKEITHRRHIHKPDKNSSFYKICTFLLQNTGREVNNNKDLKNGTTVLRVLVR